MDLSKEQRISRHKEFLKANWELIAAFAWENYLSKGKGAVLVPEEDFVYADVPQLKGLRFHYVPLSERANEHFKDILAEKELGWLSAYDPDVRVVLCVMRDEGISSYFVGGTCRCSDAYSKQKATRN